MAGASSPSSRDSREGSSASEDDGFGVAMEGAGSSPGSESHDDEDDDDDSESGSSSDDQGHREQGGFFDLEASESGDNLESEYGDFVQHYSFPQFSRLPVELQRHIWEAFCPEMARPSVYHLILVARRGPGPAEVWEDALLDSQTAAARALMSINRETRKLVLAALPDTLPIREGRKILHFNKERDIIKLRLHGIFRLDGVLDIPGFSNQLKHVALEPEHFFTNAQLNFERENSFWPNLETAYFVLDEFDCHGRHLWWSVSKWTNKYSTEGEENQTESGVGYNVLYCWPDLKHHRDFAQTNIPLDDLKQIGKDNPDLSMFAPAPGGTSLAEYAPENGIEIWPMVTYGGQDSLRRYEELVVKVESQVYEDSEGSLSDQDSESEENEYESEGIDDDSIDSPSDDDDDDLAVLPMSDNISSPGDFSPTEGEIIDDAPGGAYPMAQFSSPEAESATANDTDNSDDEAPTRAPRQRKRRVVSSDSEDESDDPNPRKRPRIANRRTNIVSDEEEDEDSEDIASHPRRRTQMRDEDSEDDDDDEDDEGGTGRPISLAERLQLHRANNPISISDEESSSAAPSIRDYEDFQDDDQSDDTGDPGSDEEALSEDAMIDGMAEESEDDDNEGW